MDVNTDGIRAEALDRIARHLFAVDAADACGGDPFDDWAARYRRKAEPILEALGDLLPTGIESRYLGRGLDRRTRYVTDWQTEVTK